MRNYFKKSIITINSGRYLALLIILVPLLNFLSGITFDLHAPSIPAIANYYSTSFSAVKNTISIALLGFSIGCLLFGVLLDVFGRRPLIIFNLLIYTVVSFWAIYCTSINELLLVRFIQGFAVSCVSIGCRTIILDTFNGHQFKVAMLYTSLAYGIGPIIAPFIGGYLQYYIGWMANFIAYGVISLCLMFIFFICISESQKHPEPFTWGSLVRDHKDVLWHKAFLPGIIIVGLCQVQLMVYAITGAFLIENVLHQSAIVYGNSALIISSGYLFGTLINRLLIKNFHTPTLITFGFFLLTTGLILQFYYVKFCELSLITIILPIFIIGFSQGFININVFSSCLKLSSKAGVTTSLFSSVAMMLGTLGIYVVSQVNIDGLLPLFRIFLISALIQAIVFFGGFRRIIARL